MFWDAFAPEFVAGLLSGGLILGVGYWRIDKRLQLKERADADQDRERDERRTRTAVLDLILNDLHQNAGQANVCLEVLPNDELPYPGFEEGGWDLVTQAPAFVTIRPETRDALHHVYNRVRSANTQLEFLRDLHNGGTSAIVHIQVATTMRDDGTFPPAVAEIFEQYETYRVVTALSWRETRCGPQHSHARWSKCDAGVISG